MSTDTQRDGLKSGRDVQQLENFFEEFRQAVVQFFKSRGFNEIEADDAAADVWEKFTRRFFEERSALIPLHLFRHARDVLSDRRAGNNNQEAQPRLVELHDELVHLELQHFVELSDLSDWLTRYLDLLSNEDREVLILKDAMDYSYREIADIVNEREGSDLAPATFASRRRRAIIKLRGLIARQPGGEDSH